MKNIQTNSVLPSSMEKIPLEILFNLTLGGISVIGLCLQSDNLTTTFHNFNSKNTKYLQRNSFVFSREKRFSAYDFQ